MLVAYGPISLTNHQRSGSVYSSTPKSGEPKHMRGRSVRGSGGWNFPSGIQGRRVCRGGAPVKSLGDEVPQKLKCFCIYKMI